MLRDRAHLCDYMPRCKDARRLQADPEHEPDLYVLSRVLPLDGTAPPAVTDLEEIANVVPRAARRTNTSNTTMTRTIAPPTLHKLATTSSMLMVFPFLSSLIVAAQQQPFVSKQQHLVLPQNVPRQAQVNSQGFIIAQQQPTLTLRTLVEALLLERALRQRRQET